RRSSYFSLLLSLIDSFIGVFIYLIIILVNVALLCCIYYIFYQLIRVLIGRFFALISIIEVDDYNAKKMSNNAVHLRLYKGEHEGNTINLGMTHVSIISGLLTP
ncbi:hypothetical protein ACJX0J_014617, partial [Zea mays]